MELKRRPRLNNFCRFQAWHQRLSTSDPNSKHWFTTSFLWRKVPESDGSECAASDHADHRQYSAQCHMRCSDLYSHHFDGLDVKKNIKIWNKTKQPYWRYKRLVSLLKSSTLTDWNTCDTRAQRGEQSAESERSQCGNISIEADS